ncbi:uncharacterized protein [Chironomus tepperi]|uniref:uncharacterized protein n=1 Tax=Chironomus tepperi TaxID=113505 RepID=UPI00391F7A48
MVPVIKIALLLFAIISAVQSTRGPCNYCDSECIKEKFGNTLKIFQRMEKKNSFNTIKIADEKTMHFNVDIAEGSATMYDTEISNLLGASIVNVKMSVNPDKTTGSAIGTFSIPDLHIVSHGKAKFTTKNNDKMSGVEDLNIPQEIDTEGELTAKFKNMLIDFNINFNVDNKPNNKVSLVPTAFTIKLVCKNINDSTFNFEPTKGISIKRAIEKAYLNVISKSKIEDYCETLVEGKEHSLDIDSFASFEKLFRRIVFDANC